MPQKYALKDYDIETYYHVFFRGINKQNIFDDDDDRQYFLSLIDRYFSKSHPASKTVYKNYTDKLAIHAYCLMNNHVHFLIYQGDDPDSLRSFMSGLLTSYSKYFNKKYGRVGTLYESRYKARIITDDDYLTHITRYIHMNPLNWRKYRWSSLDEIFTENKPKWLETQLYSQFSEKSYRRFLSDYQADKDELKKIKHLLAG